MHASRAAETVPGRVTEIIERTTTQTSRGTIEQERLGVEVGGRGRRQAGQDVLEVGPRLAQRLVGESKDRYRVIFGNTLDVPEKPRSLHQDFAVPSRLK